MKNEKEHILKYIRNLPWWIQGLFNGIFLAVILIFIASFIINPFIDPNPEIKFSCFKENNRSIVIVLENPSSSPGENINIMLKKPYSGGVYNYIEDELCSVERHPKLLDSVTKIYCEYIPPKSKIAITINLENDTNNVEYYMWGETTERTEFSSHNCEIGLTDEVRRLRGETI